MGIRRLDSEPCLNQHTRARSLVNKARNEVQKSMFLCEIARFRVEEQEQPLERSRKILAESKKRREPTSLSERPDDSSTKKPA